MLSKLSRSHIYVLYLDGISEIVAFCQAWLLTIIVLPGRFASLAKVSLRSFSLSSLEEATFDWRSELTSVRF